MTGGDSPRLAGSLPTTHDLTRREQLDDLRVRSWRCKCSFLLNVCERAQVCQPRSLRWAELSTLARSLAGWLARSLARRTAGCAGGGSSRQIERTMLQKLHTLVRSFLCFFALPALEALPTLPVMIGWLNGPGCAGLKWGEGKVRCHSGDMLRLKPGYKWRIAQRTFT